jgi:hypothetical protein
MAPKGFVAATCEYQTVWLDAWMHPLLNVKPKIV